MLRLQINQFLGKDLTIQNNEGMKTQLSYFRCQGAWQCFYCQGAWQARSQDRGQATSQVMTGQCQGAGRGGTEKYSFCQIKKYNVKMQEKKVAIGGWSCNLFLGKIYLDPSNSLGAVGREKRLKTISETWNKELSEFKESTIRFLTITIDLGTKSRKVLFFRI